MCVCVWERGTPDTFESFRGSCYNIQFKFYATSKMELSAGNCCWQLLRRSLSCERAPRSDSEMNRSI